MKAVLFLRHSIQHEFRDSFQVCVSPVISNAFAKNYENQILLA